MALGIVSIAMLLMMLVNPFMLCFSVIPAILGIIFGAVGLSQVSQGFATNRGVAIAGLVTGLIGLVGPWLLLLFGTMAVSSLW